MLSNRRSGKKTQSVATENIECPPEILKKLEKNNISQLDNVSSLDIATDLYNMILFGNYSHESVATTSTSDQDTAAATFCSRPEYSPMEIEDEVLKSRREYVNFKSNDEVKTDCIDQELLNPVEEVWKEISSSDASKMMEFDNPSDNNSSKNLSCIYEEIKEKENPVTICDKEGRIDMIPPEEPKVTVVKSPSIRNKLGLSWAKLSSSCVKLIKSYAMLSCLNRFD